ncbi:MAG: hypothetical protein OD817_06345, partial [Gammaproteobacteria bacterium]
MIGDAGICAAGRAAASRGGNMHPRGMTVQPAKTAKRVRIKHALLAALIAAAAALAPQAARAQLPEKPATPIVSPGTNSLVFLWLPSETEATYPTRRRWRIKTPLWTWIP